MDLVPVFIAVASAHRTLRDVRGATVRKKQRNTGAVPWGEIANYDFLVDDLMSRVFAAVPSDYMVTDGSRLSDFAGCGDPDALPSAQRKIREIYGIDPDALPDDYITTIVKAIARTR
jgi:hypothetical protein